MIESALMFVLFSKTLLIFTLTISNHDNRHSVSYLHIHVLQLTTETMLSLSEMYHDTFYKSKEIQFLMQTIDKNKRQIN